MKNVARRDSKQNVAADADPAADFSGKLAKFIENVLRQKAQRRQKGKMPVYNVLPMINAAAGSNAGTEPRFSLSSSVAFKKPPVPHFAPDPAKRRSSRCATRSNIDSQMCIGGRREQSVESARKDESKKSGLEAYSLGGQIGQGAYAVVRSGMHKASGRRVAVKVYEKYKLLSSQRKNCVSREIRLLKKLDHPNIVKLYETIDTPRELFLVMEFVRGNSMLSYVKSKSGKRLEEPECLRMYRQILAGICFCHKHNIVHRDIKMENMLVDEQLNVKIIDFGFSTWFTTEQKLKIFCGTPSYMAPEIVSKKEYFGPPADMWSLGILLYAMLCGSFPFRGATERELYRNISKGVFSVPTFVSSRARSVICRLLTLDPQRRPTAEDVLSLLFKRLVGIEGPPVHRRAKIPALTLPYLNNLLNKYPSLPL